jgi:hypothetical protein
MTVPGTELIPFTGQLVGSYDQVPAFMRRYVARHGEGFLIPDTIAMFANHSCEPNCDFGADYIIRSRRPILSGEEITIAYDMVDAEDWHRWRHFWDQEWTFSCRCGSDQCIGKIEGYRIDLHPSNSHLFPASGRGSSYPWSS